MSAFVAPYVVFAPVLGASLFVPNRASLFVSLRIHLRRLLGFLSLAIALVCVSRNLAAAPLVQFSAATHQPNLITRVAQFRNLSGTDYVNGCDFRLNGVITLVDTNRDLVVLQDTTGAVALNFLLKDHSLKVGSFVTLEGHNCYPYSASLPDYPYRPSGRDIRTTFEAPEDWGEYNLTRMRAYLHPPTTGDYSFWIASDNSSELWLSTDAEPSRARKIASIPRYGWVEPREWSRFPSQHSESIRLKAGGTYFIEALSEQTTVGENLAVAWQGPGMERSVIESSYLTPWGTSGGTTNGVLREYWTNYSAGDLEGLAVPRTFKSALTVERVHVDASRPGELPEPDRIALNQPLPPEDNYEWVQAEGLVRFMGVDGGTAFLQLSDRQSVVQVRVEHWSQTISQHLRELSNIVLKVKGVCEGVYNQNGTMMPGIIWASAENSVSFMKAGTTNDFLPVEDRPDPSTITNNPSMQGFYGTRGVVTFNGRVFGHDYIFVQEDAAAVIVNPVNPGLNSHLKVGQWVDLGGSLEPGRFVPVITPLVVKNLGWHAMPLPLAQGTGLPGSANQEGRWSEVEGVVQSVNTNGTLSVMGKDGWAYLWIGQTSSSNYLNHLVDAKLRARGVLLLSLLDGPLLLVPSPEFLDVEAAAPKDPFDAPIRAIADIVPQKMESSWYHRVQVVGEVTYQSPGSFFVQDASEGIRVRSSHQPSVKLGETVEVAAFPAGNGIGRSLTGALVRPAAAVVRVKPRSLDLSETLSSDQSGDLVRLSATLLAQKSNGVIQVLELQEQHRTFLATLANGQSTLPEIAPGSRLRVTGVRGDSTAASPMVDDKSVKAQLLPSLNILLRGPQDVIVLNGPPWWTLKRTVTLVGTLLTVILATLLWVHLLRRRLERQQAAQLAFSRQVLARLEDERRRIAVNLHDSLGQILLAIKNHALLAIQRPPEETGMRQRLSEISGITSQAIEEVRQITHGLRPYQLDRLGLTQAIRAVISQTTTDCSISFATRVEDIDGLFDKDAEIHVYRIVQEAVSNAVKHSGATEGTVVIKKRTAGVMLSVRDNGYGFDPVKLSSQPHELGYGLNGIAERVRILGGSLNIDSRPGRGTSLTVEVPLPIHTHDTRNTNIDRG